MRRVGILLCLGASMLLTTSAHADSFAQGSLIVPMDTTYQNTGMFKAYGLVYELLRNGVPVRWVIKQGKAFQGVDFVANAKDHKTNASITNYGYRGGPWVIDAPDAAAALPIINAWQTANSSVTVHEATAAFTADVAKYLVVAPKVAMHADGNQGIARAYLMAAGIPDSTLDYTWPNSSPDMLDPAEVAGATTSNHQDGKLFDADGAPLYCQFISMHWNVSSAQSNPEVVAEVREFLKHPVHFFAECQAVNAFENLVPYGHFLTPNGYMIMGQPNAIDNHNFDSPFAQYDGAFKTVGGSEPAYKLPPGDQYKAGGITMITAAGFPEGQYDLWMTGYIDGVCPPNAEVCGNLGKVSYLGGHQYKTNTPISSNPDSQGTRLFLNSLFDSTCATLAGQPFINLYKDAPATTLSANMTYTIFYSNAGPSVALSAKLKDPIPPGSSFVSATNGGMFANGVVSWNVGNLGDGESGSVSVTVTLSGFGTYQNTAEIDYHVGLNPFSLSSNTATTLYDKDTDGDGFLDSVDICPNDYNPGQDLQWDIDSCGQCGVVCSAINAFPACYSGVCAIGACYGDHSDCDGQYADGCEFANTGFDTDPTNCGGCGVVCGYANASGVCLGGTCSLGPCSPGHSNCNGIAGDGCEYDNTNFAFDAQHCGSCSGHCALGYICQNSICVPSPCPPGFSNCNATVADGCEYDNAGFATDNANCGGCGIVCSPPHATGQCSAGSCTIGGCNSGYGDCNGLPGDGCEHSNASFGSDPTNCGGCGIVCMPPNAVGACVAGACTIGGCNSGFSNCNGMMADGCEYDDAGFASDVANCGGCGVVCAPPNATGICAAGTCQVGGCSLGFHDKNGDPLDGCEYACNVLSATDTTCDGIDDDCDGTADDDYVPVTCGEGACVVNSNCIQGVVSCTPGAPSLEGPPGDPSCADGIDNDCNGSIDAQDVSCIGCAVDADCDDGNPCTADQCLNSLCTNAGVPNCGSGGGAGFGGAGGDAAAGGSGGGPGGTATGSGGAGATGGESTGGLGGDATASAGSGAAGGTGLASGAGTLSSSAGDPGDEGGCQCRTGAPAPSDSRGAARLASACVLLLALGRRRSTVLARGKKRVGA